MISGDDVFCRVVFGTLVGVFVFSVMWSELLMTSAISCPLWSSVYECQRVECEWRTECSMFVLFIYAAPCEWNKLSEHIRTSNFDCFRKSVKTMLFTQQYGC